MRSRWLVGVAALAGLVPLLSGCSVPVHGVLAIGKAPDGSELALIQMCNDAHVDVVDVYPSVSIKSDKMMSWSPTRDIVGAGQLSLKGMRAGMRANVTYWTSAGGDGSATDGPEFTAADFDKLAPGQFIALKLDGTSPTYSMTTYSAESFTKTVLAHCDDFD